MATLVTPATFMLVLFFNDVANKPCICNNTAVVSANKYWNYNNVPVVNKSNNIIASKPTISYAK